MKLHENKNLFQDAIAATATLKGLREIHIEKDYWVTLALYTIFTGEMGNQVVFKGGTALSKCFQMIERFSEDIDVVVLRHGGESNTQLDKTVKKIGQCIESVLPAIYIEGITNLRGKIKKTAHSYQKIYDGDFGQIRKEIILEAMWLGNFEPYTTATIQSYISEMMHYNKQNQMIIDYGLQPFEIKVLKVERTLCEKIISLVRFSFTDNPIENLRNKVRHVYDIHKLLENETIHTFFNSPAFDEMLLKVANDDVIALKTGIAWLSNHPATAILFSDTVNTWNQIQETYNSEFRAFVYGKLPSNNDILETLQKVSNRLKDIKWTI